VKKTEFYLFLTVLIFGLFLFIRISFTPPDLPASPSRQTQITIIEPKPAAEKKEPVMEINYFENEKDVTNWLLRFSHDVRVKTSLSDKEASQGKCSMEVDWNSFGRLELVLYHFPQDWTGYTRFLFDVYNPSAQDLMIELKIGDFFNASGFYPHRKRFEFIRQALPGWNHYDIPFKQISDSININSERKAIFLRTSGKNAVFYVDNVRIVR
jgi:hypothetical protein